MAHHPSPFAGGSEMLAQPIRSASLPFSVFFSSTSSEDEENASLDVSEPGRVESGVTASGPGIASLTQGEPPVTPDSTAASVQSETLSSTRRFLTDPPTKNGGGTLAGAPPEQQTRRSGAQKKSSRVSSLARWYDRLSHGSPTTPPRTTSNSSLLQSRQRRPGSPQTSPSLLHSVSLPRDFSSVEHGAPTASDEIVRLRSLLQSEKHARTEAEAQSLSLQNALRNSKKKVGAQKQRIQELNAQLNETMAAIAPVQEILSLAERNFYRKEQTLKRIIAAQQQQASSPSLYREKRRPVRVREGDARSRFIVEADL
jgi:hypothetical protein